MVLTNVDEEGWTTISYKKNSNKKPSSNSKQQFDSKRKPKRMNKDFDKTKVKLWYDTRSWQHNVLINNYKYEDGSNVLSKFNLSELYDEYSKAVTNYDKNSVIRKLTKVLNDDKWKEEESNLTLVNAIVEEVEEVVEVKEVAEVKEVVKESSEAIEVEDKKEVMVKNVVKPTRKYDSNISFAEMIKRN